MRINLVVLVVLVLLAGCAGVGGPRAVWMSDPSVAEVDREHFSATLIPVWDGNSGCEAFLLTINNKSGKNIEVNWNKTLFIESGQTSGGFMFEGVVYKDRNNPKPPDIVFQNASFSKRIWPNNLVHFSSGRYGGWRHETMRSGQNGVYLSLTIDGKEINERVTFRLGQINL